MTYNIFSTSQTNLRQPYDFSLPPEIHADEISLLNSSEKTNEAASPSFSSQSSFSLKRLTSTEEPQALKKQKSDPSNQFWDDVDISVLNPITTLETTDSLFSDSPFTLPEDVFWTEMVPLEEPKQILHESNSIHAPLSHESNSSISSSPAASSGEVAAQTDSSVSIHTAKPSSQAALKKATRKQLKEATKRAIEIGKQSTVIKEYKNKGIRIPQSSLSLAVKNYANPDLERATPKQMQEAVKRAIEIGKQSTVIEEYQNKGIHIPQSSLSVALIKHANSGLKKATSEQMQEAAKKAIEVRKKSSVMKEYQKSGIYIPAKSFYRAVRNYANPGLKKATNP